MFRVKHLILITNELFSSGLFSVDLAYDFSNFETDSTYFNYVVLG